MILQFVYADEQSAQYIIQMVDEMEKEEVDLMQGSRIGSGTALSGGMPLYRHCHVSGKTGKLYIQNAINRLS